MDLSGWLGAYAQVELVDRVSRVTGTVCPGPTAGLVGVSTGADGVVVYVRQDEIYQVSEVESAVPAGEQHQLQRYLDRVPDDVWSWVCAVHEAGHAVGALVAAIPVTRMSITGDRSARTGGTTVTGGGDAQGHAISLETGPLAHYRALDEAGYGGELVEAAVSTLSAAGDVAALRDLRAGGYIVHHHRAIRDAERIVALPAAWTAITTLATALWDRRELTAEEIRDLTHSPLRDITAVMDPVWLPSHS